MKKELYSADMFFHVPEGVMELGHLSLDAGNFEEATDTVGFSSVDLDTRRGHIEYLYYSSKFSYDERMEENAEIIVIPTLFDGRDCFCYEATVLPVYWVDDFAGDRFWFRCADLPQDTLLDSSPLKRTGR